MRLSLRSWLLLLWSTVVLIVLVIALRAHYSDRWLLLLSTDLAYFLERPFFTLGRIAVSPSFLIKSVVYMLILTVASRATEQTLRTRILPHTALDEQHRYTIARFLAIAVFLLGVMIGVDTAGVDLRSLALLGSALGLGIGLGLQPIVVNFMAGLILLMERPIRLGDRIDVAGTNGEVIRIGGRCSWICTNDNEVIIVPNSDFITNRVTNWTANDPTIRFALKVGVSYNSDPSTVREILLSIANKHPHVLADPAPEVIFQELGDNSLIFVLRIWSASELGNPQKLKSDLYFSIFAQFRQQNIEMPFPQRDLHLRTVDPSILNGRFARSAATSTQA
jgi:small-conductance mechanosensitive channel